MGVVTLRFEVGGQPPITLAAPPYQRTIDLPSIAAPGDTIQVRAIATDPSNNTGQADHVVTIVAIPDTENPTVALSVPPETSAGAALRMTATAHDNAGVARVVFSVNGAPVGTDDTPPYEASYAVPADAPVGGALTVVARAFDFSNNAADNQGVVAIVATADTTPPTVALTAPAEVRAGQALPVSATASDDIGVASVVLLVDGAPVRSFTAPPYDGSYVVPRSMAPGTVLRLTAVATDFSSNEGRAAADTRVTAPIVAATGLLTGEVYDDRTGLPIEGATVAITGTDVVGTPYDRSTVTDPRGRYSLAAGAGHGLVDISKTGRTRVQRPVDVAAGRVTAVIDARLTELAPLSAPIAPVIGGKAGAAGAELTVAAGSLAAEAALGVTSIGQQGLQALLPAGWSPVGMADVIPRGVTFQAATLRVRNVFGLAAGTTLVLAVWDETAGAWRAVGQSTVPDDAQTLTGDVPRSGQFAWLLPDSLPVAPPMPAPGEIVRGVSAPVVPETVTTAITPQPKIVIYRAGVVSDVRGVLTGASPLSSGTLVWTRISETYRFRSGGEVSPEPYTEDLVLFQTNATGASVSASYPVTPSLAFEAASLDRGVITVELIAPPALTDLPVAVGPDGTTVAFAGDRFLQIPAGALAESDGGHRTLRSRPRTSASRFPPAWSSSTPLTCRSSARSPTRLALDPAACRDDRRQPRAPGAPRPGRHGDQTDHGCRRRGRRQPARVAHHPRRQRERARRDSHGGTLPGRALGAAVRVRRRQRHRHRRCAFRGGRRLFEHLARRRAVRFLGPLRSGRRCRRCRCAHRAGPGPCRQRKRERRHRERRRRPDTWPPAARAAAACRVGRAGQRHHERTARQPSRHHVLRAD